MPADTDDFDPDRILAVLDGHQVEYLLVGGLAARAYGAERRTADVDCVPSTTTENLERIAAALRELGARLRVGGMTDEEARQLPVRLDVATLVAFGSSTWMTDAGPLDLLVDLRDRHGERHDYGELLQRSVRYRVGGLTVGLASLDDTSRRRSSPAATRTARDFGSCSRSTGAVTMRAARESCDRRRSRSSGPNRAHSWPTGRLTDRAEQGPTGPTRAVDGTPPARL